MGEEGGMDGGGGRDGWGRREGDGEPQHTCVAWIHHRVRFSPVSISVIILLSHSDIWIWLVHGFRPSGLRGTFDI